MDVTRLDTFDGDKPKRLDRLQHEEYVTPNVLEVFLRRTFGIVMIHNDSVEIMLLRVSLYFVVRAHFDFVRVQLKVRHPHTMRRDPLVFRFDHVQKPNVVRTEAVE
jgi:hypothetical protein